MGLEFIDISRDEEVYVRPRTQGASNRRRATGPERAARKNTSGKNIARQRREIDVIIETKHPRKIEVQNNRTVRRYPREIDPRIEQERIRRKKRRKRRAIMARIATLSFLVSLIVLLSFVLVKQISGLFYNKEETTTVFKAGVQKQEEIKADESFRPMITEDFIPINEYSRPGEKLEKVNNIFVHYTANQGTSAAQNRSYFENLGITGETSASAHFVIGYDGEIIQCVPLDEIAYAVMKRNYDSISIECCYLSDDGKFTDATYQSLIRLSAWLLKEYQLAPEDMRRHYDEGGKRCPLYFVEHEDAWERFLKDLKEYIIKEQV